MPTTARPFSRRSPTLVAGEPIEGPRDGRFSEQIKWRPFAYFVIKETQRWGYLVVPIDMRQRPLAASATRL
jgi:hypothetical protein